MAPSHSKSQRGPAARGAKTRVGQQRLGDAFIVMCDEEGTITAISQAAIDAIGRDGDDLLGSNIACLGVMPAMATTRATQMSDAHHPRAAQSQVPAALQVRLADGTDAELNVARVPVMSSGRPAYAVVPGPPTAREQKAEGTGRIEPAPVSCQRDPRGLPAEMELLLSRRLVQSVEADLARASLDIHDGVAQSMSNAVQILQAVASSPALDDVDRHRISQALVLLREGISDARFISRELLPASLERLGLAKTLKYELEILSLVGVVSSFTFDVPDPLPKHLEVALYRIAAEALLNVKKHAHARAVTLGITSDHTTVTMTISDDGAGFTRRADENVAQTGLGLMSMHARSRLLGGTFEIVTAPGTGTLITVALPLPAPAETRRPHQPTKAGLRSR